VREIAALRNVYDIVCTECGRVLETGHERCPVDGAPVTRRSGAGLGTVLADRYRLDEVIGRGAWATVYRARDLSKNLDVALKLLAPELRGHGHSVQRFLEEARTLEHLHHPNVVTVRDCGQSGRSVFMVLELGGRALSEEIVREAPIVPARAVRIALQICDGLGAAHDRGFVHRDLKPDNILLVGGAHDEYQVADFGIARSLVGDRARESGGFAGTAAYASPEQARGDEADARSDLYALGLVLYEMLAGEPAFPREKAFLTLQRRIHGPPEEISSKFPDLPLPDGLGHVVSKLLAHSPDDRPRNAAAARALLLPYGEPSGVSRAAEPAEVLDFPVVYTPLDFSPVLCGRDEDLAPCMPLVERLGEIPHATVLVIAGAGGVGKSRVAARLAEVACAKRGARRCDKECSDSGLPLREIGQVIEDLLGTRTLDATVLEQRLAEVLSDAHGAKVLLQVLRPAPADDGSIAQAVAQDAEAHRNYQCQVVLDALAHLAAPRPLCIVLDDAQAADALTRAVIARIPLWSRDRGKGLLFIVTWTTGADPEPPAEVQRERFAKRARLIRLEALSAERSDALLRAMGLQDPDARTLIGTLAAGNPLYLVQLVRHLKNERLLISTRRGWRLAPRARFDLSVPPVIESLGARQVGQLRKREGAGALAADLLERAALLGDRPALPVLRGLLQREGRLDLLEKVDVLLDLLVAEGLVQRAEPHIVFLHALVRQAIASRAAERHDAKGLHIAIADALLASTDLDAQTPRAAALHLLRGGAPDRALPLALQSAALARSLGDTAHASEDYLLALRILEAQKKPSRAKRLEVELGLGDTLLLRGDTRPAEEHFMNALKISKCAAAHEGLGKVAELKADFGRASDHLGQAERLYRSAGRAREAAKVSIWLGRTVQKLGDLKGAAKHLQRAHDAFADLGDAVGAARAQAWLGTVSLFTGDYDRGLELLKAALPALEATGNPLLIGDCLNGMASIHAEMRHHEVAIDTHRKAQIHYERAGAIRGVGNSIGAIGTAKGYLGAFDEAQRLIEAALRITEDTEYEYGVATWLVNLGWLGRLAGKLEESTQWLRAALLHLQRHQAHAGIPFAQVELGLTLLACGKLDEAEAEFRRTLRTRPLRPDLRAQCLEGLRAIARARATEAAPKGKKPRDQKPKNTNPRRRA